MNRAKLLDGLYRRLTAEIAPQPGVRNHGKRHWREVARLAGELAELAGEPPALIHAVIAAGLLHDIGRVSDSSRADPQHGLTSVAIAREQRLLALLDVPRQHWDEVYQAIADHTHGWRTKQQVARYLWDADRLCLVGLREELVDPRRMSSSVWRRLCRWRP